MDNAEWSHADSYFLSFVSDVEERYTENVYLIAYVKKKQKFKFIFDFGDEWRLNAKC